MDAPNYQSSTTPICKKCKNVFIQITSFFCPYCGTACLENLVIKEKTTASYDPRNPLLKPWREPPPSLSLPPIKNNFHNPDPWRPTMKQPKKPKLSKKKSLKSIQNQIDKEVPDDSTFDKSLRTDEVQFFDGQPFQRAGRNDIRLRKEHILSSEGSGVDDEESSSLNEQVVDLCIDQLTISSFPLAAYDASWLVELKAGFTATIHVSLTDRCIRNTHQYWIRVGVVFEADDASEISTNSGLMRAISSSGYIGELIPLCYISNDVGRLLNSNLGKDWVELEAVRGIIRIFN